MAETTVVTTSENEPEGGGDVAGVVAGAAAVEAANAGEAADEAQATAEVAGAEAAAATDAATEAYRVAAEADARTLSTEQKLDALATIQLHEAQQRARATEAAATPAAGGKPSEGDGDTNKDKPPRSLEKKQKRRTLREWYEGG